MWQRPGHFAPKETTSTVGGRAFTIRSEIRVTGIESAVNDVRERQEVFLWVGTAIGPCPVLRVAPRETNRLNDDNAGAVATGVPRFDDRFLVFCDDLAFVRRVTPALASAPPSESIEGLELGGGWIVAHRRGAGTETIAANYLNVLIPLLPPELRR
jgi:hypothetical protein